MNRLATVFDHARPTVKPDQRRLEGVLFRTPTADRWLVGTVTITEPKEARQIVNAWQRQRHLTCAWSWMRSTPSALSLSNPVLTSRTSGLRTIPSVAAGRPEKHRWISLRDERSPLATGSEGSESVENGEPADVIVGRCADTAISGPKRTVSLGLPYARVFHSLMVERRSCLSQSNQAMLSPTKVSQRRRPWRS